MAFVGSEATGKSTLLNATQRWLGRRRDVRRAHAGKPPATALTLVPHRLLPALRALFPDSRTTRVEADDVAGSELAGPFPLLFGLRSVMLAYERRALLTRAAALAAHGAVVLCDRYPSARSGSPDSPQLPHRAPEGDSLRRWLARLEARLYREIPPPDLVVHLTAPLDVTLARNRVRGKREPEDHVRRRHAASVALRFDGSPVVRVATDRPFDAVAGEVKEAIAHALSSRA